MKKSFFILLLIPFLFSCGRKHEKSKEGNIVKLSILSQVRSLDPRISNEYPSVHVINMLYEGLMRLGPNGEIIPGVAESVSISEDQKTYTFYLRDSMWSNGDPVTAHDFEYAWKKSINPLHARTGAYTFYTIKNASACLEKKVDIGDVGIRAIDDKTLEVELDHPAPYFLSLCASSTYAPIHKRFDLEDPHWANGVNDHFVNNGPFILKRWKKGVEIYLESNPNYWDAQCVKIGGIHIQILPDANTQYLLYQKKELDWVGFPFNSLPIDVIGVLYEKGELQVIDAYGLDWFFVNTEKPPFDNKNFRKAISFAIDRKSIAEHIFQLGEEPAMGILNGELSLQKEPYFEDGNIELAKKHLSLALEEMGTTLEELPQVVICESARFATSPAIQEVQQQLSLALGLHIEIDQADWPVHFNRMSKGDFQFGAMGWNSLIKDPIYMLDTFRHRSSATNMSRWEHPVYQELLKKSDNEIDPEKRKEYMHRAEAVLMEEMVVIPLCFSRLHYLSNKNLKGVYMSSFYEIDFRYAYFE